MSADNGIYILPVVCFPSGNKQFRVTYGMAIENLTYEPDRKDGYNTNSLRDYFDKSKPYASESEAHVVAFMMDKEYDILEYGISTLDPCVITNGDKDPFTPQPIAQINEEYRSNINQSNLETLRSWVRPDPKNTKFDAIKGIMASYIDISEREKMRKSVEILELKKKIDELTKEKNNFRDKWIAEKATNAKK
jgi:hypothetical protein